MPAAYWPRANRFREMLHGDTPPVVMWMTLGSPDIVEMAGGHGLDAAIMDLEHTTASLSDVQAMIVAAQGAGMTALVRPSSIDAHQIGRLLDAGAEGIVFAMVSNAQDAQAALASVRYPPHGTRGWAGNHARHVRWSNVRSSDSDHPLASAEFAAAANDSIARIFMIENAEGVEEVDSILDAGQPDGVFFGWADFGVGVDFDADVIAKAHDRVYQSCRARGIGLCLTVNPKDKMAYYPGCFYSAGVDASLASAVIHARLEESRATIAELGKAAG